MSTDALIKLVLGIALLLAFFPTGYLNLPPAVNYIIIIIAAIIGIKLILDAVRQL